MKKRFLSLGMAIVMMLSLCVTAFAAPCALEVPLGDNPPSSITPYASTPPTNHKNLGTATAYKATLTDLAASKSSYTLYYFSTPTGKIYLNCDLRASGTTDPLDRELDILLYDFDGFLIDSKTVEFNDRISAPSSRRIFANLDPDQFYYIKFRNSSGTSIRDHLDISGTILIDDVFV